MWVYLLYMDRESKTKLNELVFNESLSEIKLPSDMPLLYTLIELNFVGQNFRHFRPTKNFVHWKFRIISKISAMGA